MRVGVGLPAAIPGADPRLTIEWARRADDGPFSSVGVIDRIVYDCHECMAVMAAAAAVTSRVRLATTIAIAPIRNTAVLAKEAATVHALSGGRFVFGVGLGGRADDYEVAEVELQSRGRRMSQQLDAIRSHWESSVIGPHFGSLGAPELLVGGLSDQAFARMARYADGYVHGGGPPRAFASAAAKARAAWTDTGRPGRPVLWGQGYFALGDREAETGADYLKHYYAFAGPFADRVASGLLTSPQAIVQFVRGYEDEGCDEIVLFPTVADISQLERLANVVAEFAANG